jgi:uncharacterized protein YecE (DUF72 family)
MAKVYIGTSGFAYASWKPTFYPEKLPAAKFLEHYGTRLTSSEINYTFRRLPTAKTLENWVKATPEGFLFSVKAHMRLTHILKLKECGEFLDLFFKSIEPLRSARRLGAVLFQLPPAMKADLKTLAEFLALLPEDLRHTFEFRHESWLQPELYELLQKHGAALCLAESEKLIVPKVLTGSFVYSRLRKPEYTEDDRKEIAAEVLKLQGEGRDVFLYFKHEERPEGALYAEDVLSRVTAS